MYHAIVFLPLLGCLIAGLFGRFIGARNSEVITTALVFVSAALSWVAFFNVGYGGETTRVMLFTWVEVGSFKVDWALRIDTLTAVMLVVVNTVSALVHLYSIGYMADDPHRQRFFSYLSLFTFAMLSLVTADNLVQMFFGWEGVGLASYLLIGFWYLKPSANAAAIKAFVVNRIGDFGFALGICATYWMVGSIDFDTIFAQAPSLQGKVIPLGSMWPDALTLICLLLFMGAMGKSAQFLLHTWLPDAMEGPTPVSALIHAATMVTAGVFMVARLSPLFELSPTAQEVVILVGATTALFAATVGLVQNDIKRVIAYSTCSQLGYMFVAMGVGAYSVGMFHLFTHAFFKALLFLGSGAVIIAMHHEQDIRKMGGLRKALPFTYAMMVIGTLALTGFPFTAGFYSKDAIVESAFASHAAMSGYGFWLLVIAAALTSFYSWRLILLTFHGTPRFVAEGHGHGHETHGHAGHAHGDHGHHAITRLEDVHEAPKTMLLPLLVLAVGALGAGFAFKAAFVDAHGVAEFFRQSISLAKEGLLEEMHHLPPLVVFAPTIAMVAGFAVAVLFYVVSPQLPVLFAQRLRPLYLFLLNKWYFDELYDAVFVNPAKRLGRFLWKQGDGAVIDGLGPDGVAARVLDTSDRVVRLQTGYLYHYAFAMLIGVAALVTWFMFAAGVR
ncbi:NADH-quinone oxidoreductase subunit L [Blastochloris tepida]|uniref:NADH-quinone oxidoreductase subunit L n=1 Tax=Blastochloris tepida TaxID=2233851 RepID=A0A348FY55_9HYPH|nr:NADH-quinone oxidoreductase subunit L [Blastochloris tepida]BBF92238.1 NADH-quinone oxidoreductase subunit L [Blastochloris tepida]